MPTYRGGLQNKEDAVYIIEACLRGTLLHPRRGPQDGEATISGNVFVWEANSTGIDRRTDGVEWTVREGDGFEAGEAIDASGILKKRRQSASLPVGVFIPWCPTIRHGILDPWLGHPGGA